MTSPCIFPRLILLDLRTRPFRRLSPSELSDGCILCLGNFDGVHPAHAAILREGIRLNRSSVNRGLCGVFCFLRPSSDFRPDRPAVGEHLTTLKEKLTLIADSGVDFACLCSFSEVRNMSPETFTELLKDKLHCLGTVCGFNYRFGAGGRGTPDILRDAFGNRAVILSEMTVRLPGHDTPLTISSSHIRAALDSGDPSAAAVLAGRPYALSAPVVRGKQLGRTIGFPTANQFFPAERLVPLRGVYAVRVTAQGRLYPGVANVGTHPTIDKNARVNCETYIIGFSGSLYGQRITIEFLRFLRRERKFASLNDLAEAIRADAADASFLLCPLV